MSAAMLSRPARVSSGVVALDRAAITFLETVTRRWMLMLERSLRSWKMSNGPGWAVLEFWVFGGGAGMEVGGAGMMDSGVGIWVGGCLVGRAGQADMLVGGRRVGRTVGVGWDGMVGLPALGAVGVLRVLGKAVHPL